jgi:NAD(P)-dependent dehydrogenase (short-subunit alcohol dehydrogenase family)
MVVMTSIAAWVKIQFSGAYAASKLAINCLVEFLASENPNIPIFSVHPGGVFTDTTRGMPEHIQKLMIDTAQLPACTVLALTNGEYDWLSGR